MFRLVLLHQRRAETSRLEVRTQFLHDRARQVGELAEALGYQRYSQVHQSRPFNPLYRGILITRSRWLTQLLARVQGVPGARGDARVVARWDVVEELEYASQQAMLDALTGPAGIRALAMLREGAAHLCARSFTVAGECLEPVADSNPRCPRTQAVFLLRRSRMRTRRSMLAYWSTSHLQRFVAAQEALGYVAYSQLQASSSAAVDGALAPLRSGPVEELEAFDGVASVAYPGQIRLALGFLDPRTQLANLRLVMDEVRFLDGPRSTLVFGQRVPLLGYAPAGQEESEDDVDGAPARRARRMPAINIFARRGERGEPRLN